MNVLFRRRSLLAVGVFALPFVAHGTTIDFEDLTAGQTTVSPIVYNNAGGSGVDVSFSADSIYIAGTGTSNGISLLSGGSTKSPITVSFSSLVNGFSLDTGDFGADDDSPVTIQLYGASNNLLDTVSGTWNASQDMSVDPWLHLSSNALGIKTVVFSSGGVFPNSMYIDNVTFTGAPVPEPATMSVLGIGSLALLRRRRKASR